MEIRKALPWARLRQMITRLKLPAMLGGRRLQKRLHDTVSAPKLRLAIEIDGEPLSHVRLLGLSKVGHLSWVGSLGEQPVKVYQVFGPSHAVYIERVSEHPVLGEYFPKVICRKNEYLVVEWVDGRPLSPREVLRKSHLIHQIAHLQVVLHAESADMNINVATFDYIAYLEKRLYRYLGPFVPDNAISQMLQEVHGYACALKPKVSHPDVTPRNLVIQTGTGKLKVVDNELLTQSWYYLIDLFNTYASLGESQRLAEQYIEAYHRAGGDLTPLLDHSSFFLAVWGLRVVGAMLQAGDVERAFHLADQMCPARCDSHALMRAAERVVV